MSSIPSFTSLEEVTSHLNASGPDVNGNYTVYGLPISASSVQSHVDHANKYLSSLVPSLVALPNDPRMTSAQLAALDIACLSILITAVGGSLVGAYDYFLGDMRVARAGPYAFAIKQAIDGYSAGAKRNISNATSPLASAKTALGCKVPNQFRMPAWPLS